MMKKIFFAFVGLLLLATFVATLVFLYQRSEAPPAIYETYSPLRADIVQKTVATGSVVPRQEIEIKPQVSGILETVDVEPGDQVKRGDRIARIRIVPNLANLSGAESRLNRAKIRLDDARTEHERNRSLFREGLIAEAELRTFALGLANAEEELAAAEDNLAVIREGARKDASAATNTLAQATISGMVLEVPVEVGDSVIEANTFNDGTTLAFVADMEEMVFEGKVDESEVGKIREGMPLILTIGALEDQRFDAVLEYIAPKGVEENGAIQFEIRAAVELGTVELPEGQFLRANYSANADIVLARRDGVLAIQESWLFFEADGTPYVEVETAPQRFEKRPIRTGLSDGITVEVLSGLEEGEKIKGEVQGAGGET